MTVPYLHFMLDASYFDIAIVLGYMFLGECVYFLCNKSLDCCKSPSKCLLIVQVLTSVIVMTGSSVAFSTIHIWPGVNGSDLKALRIGLAALFNGLAGFASKFYIFQSLMLFPEKEIPGCPVEFMGGFIAVAIWIGLLWLPIDFPTQTYWLFGLVSMIVFLFTWIIFMGFCWLSRHADKNKYTRLISPSSPVEAQERNCCKRIRKFGCLMWLSWMTILLFEISITSIPYFLVDWQMSCGDPSCLLIPNSSLLYDGNYPIRIYLVPFITHSVGDLAFWASEALCKPYIGIIMGPITLLAMGVFDIALFAIGYMESQPLWAILLIVSAGFCALSLMFVIGSALLIYDHESMELSLSGESNREVFHRLLGILTSFGPMIGIILISLVLENSDYITLSKIFSVLILLAMILMVALFIRVRTLKSTNAGDKGNDTSSSRNEIVGALQKAKPRMIFKKSIKSA